MHHEITWINKVNALSFSAHFVSIEKKLGFSKEAFKSIELKF